MLSLREQIAELLSRVPEKKLQEVLSFVEFTVWRTQAGTQALPQQNFELLTQEVETFFQEPPTIDARDALWELCAGIFESEVSVARDHDAFLYDAPQRERSL